MVADIIAPKRSIIFRRLIRLGSFSKCSPIANVTANQKDGASPGRERYRPMSITPILSKVYDKLVSHMLSGFARNMVFCLLLSLLIGKVWAALMHC